MSETAINIEEIKDRWHRCAVSHGDMAGLFDRIEELEGIGEGEICHRCKRKYDSVVWTVSDKLWEKVSGIEGGSGLYCPDCFSKMAEEKNIELYWEPCVDHFLGDKLKLAEDAIEKALREVEATKSLREADTLRILVQKIVRILIAALKQLRGE